MTDTEADTAVEAWKTAAEALIRGGHVDEPIFDVQLAATNYVIRAQMARTLLDELEAGRCAIRYEDGVLYYVLSPDEGDEDLMEIARIAEDGAITYS